MNIKNWREFAFLFMMISSILWIILTFIEMIFYAGGTYINPNSAGYNFFSNFNSDLGRTIAHSGRPNTISYVIFTINHTIYCISLILFFTAMYHFFSENGLEKWLSLAGSIVGIFVGVGFLGIVFTPSNVYHDLHIMFNTISFCALLLAVILYSIATYLNKEYPNIYSIVYVIYIVIVGIYLIVLFTGPSSNTAEGLMVQATWQKILLFGGIIVTLIQGYGAWKLEKS